MDLRLYFNPALKLEDLGIAQGAFAFSFEEDAERWSSCKIALVFVNEYRGAGMENSAALERNIMRQLMALQATTQPIRICNLGELRNGDTAAETAERLGSVVEILLNHSVLPLIIGGSHDIDFGQYIGYQNIEKLISVLCVDPCLDMHVDDPLLSERHVHRMLTHEPNFLFDYAHIAYQRYFCHHELLQTLFRLSFHAQSLGEVKGQHVEMEPVIRASDMLSIDLSAIKSSEAQAVINPQPFGLAIEEIAQYVWYAGISEKMSSLGLYGYLPEKDTDGVLAKAIAVFVWYFCEGYVSRAQEHSVKTNFHVCYRVAVLGELSANAPEIVFYKSKLTDRWWLAVPSPDNTLTKNRMCIVPCSYKDYQDACEGLLPERWIRAYEKLF